MFGKKSNSNNYSDSLNNNKTHNLISIISENMHIKGEVHSSGEIRIDGSVEGNITTESRVIIGPKGNITGNLTANCADIEGRIIGKINVADLLNLKATAIVEAEIKVGDISIEKGAKFDGNCSYFNKNLNKAIENINEIN